jgi:hypothetical protein
MFIKKSVLENEGDTMRVLRLSVANPKLLTRVNVVHRRDTNPPKWKMSLLEPRALVRTMVRTRNGKWLCRGRGCHTIYEAREVIDPESEDWRP